MCFTMPAKTSADQYCRLADAMAFLGAASCLRVCWKAAVMDIKKRHQEFLPSAVLISEQRRFIF